MSSTSATKAGCNQGSRGATSFPFLELPRELRDLIYGAILRMSAPLPSFPSIDDHLLEDGLRAKVESFCCDYFSMYPRFPLPTIAATLLTLNRQVHAEVKMVMFQKDTTRPLIYKLDCMVLGKDYGWLYPTWLSIPALSPRVDVLEANFRPFGDVHCFSSHCAPAPFHGRGAMVWGLLGLLKRFLKRGPDFLCPPMSTGVKIRELVLNVVTPEESLEGFMPFAQRDFGKLGHERVIPLTQPHSVRPTGLEDLNSPKKVVHEMKNAMELFWSSESTTDLVVCLEAVEVFQALRESVEVIRVCLDGKEMGTWDVKGIEDRRRTAFVELWSPCL